MEVSANDSRECPFCSAWFSRVDAAKRHAKRCSQRNGRDLIDRKRGRRVRSCDQCSRVKVHCRPRSEGPCERCLPRKLPCSFHQHKTDTATPDHPATALSDVVSDRCGERIPLSFLLNATDDQQDFLTERTVGMEPDCPPLGPACLPVASRNAHDGLSDFLDPSVMLFFDQDFSVPSSARDELSFTYDEHQPDDFAFAELWDTDMSSRLAMLETELTKHVERSFEYQLPFDVHAYRSFFSAHNARNFITTFCRKRHYRYQIIHWPTFEPNDVPLALLMVICLTGAAYSFAEEQGSAHAVQARNFYQLADSYVFKQLENHLYGSLTEPKLTTSIELCQAALLTYALDILPAGDMAMQHTAVARRLPTIITAMRALGFMNVQHEPSESWQVFVHREQRIRLVAWTFCADCLATLSCNKPPGFSIPEMLGDLPCDSEVWDADLVSFLEQRQCLKPAKSHSLAELMAQWPSDKWLESIGRLGSSVFHLHVILCGKSPRLICEVAGLTSAWPLHQTDIDCHSLPTHHLQFAYLHGSCATVSGPRTRPRYLANTLAESPQASYGR